MNYDFPNNICPLMFGTCQTPGIHSSGIVDSVLRFWGCLNKNHPLGIICCLIFLDAMSMSQTLEVLNKCQDLISEIPHVAKL